MAEFTGKFCKAAGITRANFLTRIKSTPLNNGLMVELLMALDNADLDDLGECLGVKRPALKSAMTRQKMKLVKLKKTSNREGSLDRQNAFLAEPFSLPKTRADRPEKNDANKGKRAACENCLQLLAANKADQERYERKLEALEKRLEEANTSFKEYKRQTQEKMKELKENALML